MTLIDRSEKELERAGLIKATKSDIPSDDRGRTGSSVSTPSTKLPAAFGLLSRSTVPRQGDSLLLWRTLPTSSVIPKQCIVHILGKYFGEVESAKLANTRELILEASLVYLGYGRYEAS